MLCVLATNVMVSNASVKNVNISQWLRIMVVIKNVSTTVRSAISPTTSTEDALRVTHRALNAMAQEALIVRNAKLVFLPSKMANA